MSATRDGVWNVFGGLALSLWGDDAYTYAWQATGDTSTSPATVQPEVMSGTYDVGSVNFWLDEGVEFTPSPALTVTSGSSPSGTISVSEGGAQRLQIPSYKYSGKPGITTTVNRCQLPRRLAQLRHRLQRPQRHGIDGLRHQDLAAALPRRP